MIRAAAESRLRCGEHPHRRGVRKCARCMVPACEECAAKFDSAGLCEPCATETAELDRITNVPPRERVRRFGLSVRSALIFAVIVAAIATPIALSMRSLVDTPISPEEFARFRYAAGGSFETPDGVNALSTVLGASIYFASVQEAGHEAKRLIDEYVGEGYGGYRVPSSLLPIDVFIETGQPTRIDKVIATQQPGELLVDNARVIELYVAIESPDGPWEFVGRIELKQIPDRQTFAFSESRAVRWLDVRFVSNYGGDTVTLGEINAFMPRGALSIQQQP